MRRLCWLALLFAFSCEDRDAVELASCRKDIFGALDQGWLSVAGSKFDSCARRKELWPEVAKKIREAWPAIETSELQASQPRSAYDEEPIARMFKDLSTIDPELPAMRKALEAKAAAAREERALAQAKADAEAAKDHLVIYREGFEDEDLEDCVNAAIAPLIEKAPVLEMKGPVPALVLDAASGSIGVKTEVDFATYTEEGGGQPKAHVLRGLKITVTPRLKKKKLPSEWVVELGRDTPSSISGNRGESATGKAAQMQLDNLRAVWAQACAELKAKIH